jgi:hypothetical protein
MIGKQKIERMCRAAGMVPAKRETINGVEIFIADGFAAMPHTVFGRFGVEPGDFPFGCFATLWWASKGDEKLDAGQPRFFAAFHDPEIGHGSKQRARINSAMQHAKAFLEARKKARLNG